MERLLKAARAAGSTIIHAPSGTMDTYEGTPARVRAQQQLEAQLFEEGKERTSGLHFLSVQRDPEADEPDGFWLLKDTEC